MKSRIVLMATLLSVVGCSTPEKKMDSHFGVGEAKPNRFWWPDQINLSPLRQHAKESSPMDKRFNYAKEFKKLNLDAVKADIRKVLTTSQDWWPADYGHYGPFFIRMAWHSAGTYRVMDGRGGAGGGQQRFEPLNSWPDNANLDKARRLLWPIKKKYGKKISWADLMVLTGNVSLEDMGFKTFGFAGGRTDDWEADLVYWGPETKWLDDKRYEGDRKLERPLAAVQMGLIYVNPEGPNGVPDPLLAAKDIRETFGRMAMDDEETAALIAGGHTFGKAHGAHKVEECVGKDPGSESIEKQGEGWINKCGKGHSEDTITSGLEGAWTATPTLWTTQYLDNLYAFTWKQTKSPAGAIQWVPEDENASNLVPDAHIEGKRHAPIMFTTDLALKRDPIYREITTRFRKNPKEFERAFAKAWFKLTHRDMGPLARYLGKDKPKEILSWQDPIPRRNHKLINKSEVASLKRSILRSGLTNQELVRTAWASAASFRGTDMRGGANGARVSLLPQRNWKVNNPEELTKVLAKLREVHEEFNGTLVGGKKVSFADVIVLGGAAAIEDSARKAGYKGISVPYKLGRMDATQAQTDVKSFGVLEPLADGFRNYFTEETMRTPTYMLVDKANMLSLTVPEMTVLIGGLRSLDANTNGVKHGVFTKRPGLLSNDFFVNLLDMRTKWEKSNTPGIYNGVERKSGKVLWTGTPVDLVFGSHAELRAIAEVYASDDAKYKFARDFVKAWSKVMQLDRFDIK
ncbi:catalase-peroxidase [Halobacteriovorax marinus SJ]|uniref:Catalase-peroxidase n=1 Tax=Halobacteriovorax marinus (strain ATCC BAA-682 / DSM 15412 / SJ) TaxID=862908 RepID=E1WY52_HALMS|nr:catalase/peroxidase HPI [Halobacteriovorax marinus]CBW27607.1 catalase-peroxidase [Halobacteriovorax marinus SJ]